MSSTAGTSPAGPPATEPARSAPTTTEAVEATRALTPGEIAWIAALPAALVTLLAILLLGPALGRALFPPGAIELWPDSGAMFRPEPAEHGRYLVALTGPLLLAALTWLGAHRAPRLRPSTTAALVTGAQLAGLAFVAACLIAQRQFLFTYPYATEPFRRSYFSVATLAFAAVATAALVAALRSDAVRARLQSWARETRTRRGLALLVAVAAIVVWLLHAYNTEHSIVAAHDEVSYHLMFPLDETFAVLNGRSPLVDFAAQYGSLWPYGFALVMSLVGDSIGVWSALAVGLTGLAMVGMYAVLRRVTRSSLAALALFLPFLATSFFVVIEPLANRYSFATLPGTFPLRYAGPFLLAWLLARHLDGARPRQPWLLFLAAGLVALNNADAGVPALGATGAGLLWTAGRPTRASLARLALALAAGLLGAFALVSALTLARTGSLPDLGLLVRYARLFGAAGFGMLPMPTLGLHLVVYLTFVAAIGVATVRAISGERDRLLTGMLAFCGVFGLGAGAYYVGRSHPDSLIASFTTWSFTVALLATIVVRQIAARPRQIPSIAALACIFGLAVAACSLAQTPLPWQQIERISRTGDPFFASPPGEPFVARHTTPGEAVAILNQLGHRIGANLGVTNVTPYTGSQSIWLPEQLDETLALLREAGGRKVFLWLDDTPTQLQLALGSAGYRLRDQTRDGITLWVAEASR